MTHEELTTLIYAEIQRQSAEPGGYASEMAEPIDVDCGEYGDIQLDGGFNLAKLARVILERLAQEPRLLFDMWDMVCSPHESPKPGIGI